MDMNGNIVEQYNYDAWGRRRNPDTWTYDDVPEPQMTRIGYTGHEHWDEVNLINMTGRLYDPYLARVLNPDPYVSDPNSSQALNRYTYAMNNPFVYTDPNGENVIKKFKKARRWVENNIWYPFWDALNGTPNPETGEYEGGLAQRMPSWVPPVSVGYNTSQGVFYSVNNNEPIYYNQAKVNYAAVAANVEYEIRNQAASYAANGGGDWTDITGAVFTKEDVYNNFGHNHSSYPTTRGTMKLFSDFNGRNMSQQASKYFKLSTGIKWLGNIGTAVTVANSTINIIQGDETMWDWADGTVGLVGLANSAAMQWSSFGIPVFGQVVAGYFGARSFYNRTLYMTNYYIDNGVNPGMQYIFFKE